MKKDFTVKRMPVEALPAFLAVAEHRSFTMAAARLGLSPSAVSQIVRALEDRVGTALFSRTTRSVALTEAGELFLAQVRPAMAEIDASFSMLDSYASRPSGLLRINASRGVLPFLLEPLEAFLAQNPDVEAELFADDGLSDIVREGFDAGIRMGEMLQPDMIAVRLSPPFRFVVAATPAYLAAAPALDRPEDLAAHRCIRFRMTSSGRIATLSFQRGGQAFEVTVAGRLIVNDTPAMMAAVLGGMGLAQIAEPLVAEHVAAGRLLTVLDGYAAETPGLFLYYPKRNTLVPKLRAFVDFVRSFQLPKPPTIDVGREGG